MTAPGAPLRLVGHKVPVPGDGEVLVLGGGSGVGGSGVSGGWVLVLLLMLMMAVVLVLVANRVIGINSVGGVGGVGVGGEGALAVVIRETKRRRNQTIRLLEKYDTRHITHALNNSLPKTTKPCSISSARKSERTRQW